MHLTSGILRHFRDFYTPELDLPREVYSTSAHPQVIKPVDLIISASVSTGGRQ